MSISYKTLPAILFQEAELNPVSEPSLVLYNTSLAQDLGFTFDVNVFTELLVGNNTVFDPKPIAQAYSGHQFGHYNILGDGRAMLIDEIKDKNGHINDIQLKGSGTTPYARRGDGKATLSAMLREYVYSEAMHALNIPTTRSLAVLSTGEPVYREKVHMGGVLVRIAESHIRVGTFEFARQKGSLEELKELTDYTINRHYSYLEKEADKYLKFLNEVMLRQIDLIVNWCRVGFVGCIQRNLYIYFCD